MLAVGGSTNAIIHLAAMAGRSGHDVSLDRLDKMAREVPVIVDLKPSGTGYMEDLHNAGGLVRILDALGDLIDKDAITISGKTLGEELTRYSTNWPQEVVRNTDSPLFAEGGLAVLYGNLAPDGAIIKASAASSSLLTHEGRAIVFEDMADLAQRIDSPDLDVTAEDILVLRYIGPKGAPGMPEAGLIPIPRKLARQGVKDMGAHLGWQDERHGRGYNYFACCPRSGNWRGACLCRNRGYHLAKCGKRRLEVRLSEAELAA